MHQAQNGYYWDLIDTYGGRTTKDPVFIFGIRQLQYLRQRDL